MHFFELSTCSELAIAIVYAKLHRTATLTLRFSSQQKAFTLRRNDHFNAKNLTKPIKSSAAAGMAECG